MLRGRHVVALDLKRPEAVETLLEVVSAAEIFLEGWRPGVAERLGVGPDTCLARNPRLIYGRMTGWGQDGPLALRAGHDINYIALTGGLHMCGRPDSPPSPPLNFLGDFGGGGMLLAFGVMAAAWEASRSGVGQVVDAAMVDGAALLATTFAGLLAGSMWSEKRGTNLIDGGAPFYDSYETADGKYIAVGAVEARFQVQLYAVLGLHDIDPDERTGSPTWAATKERVAAVVRTRTRAEWCDAFAGIDACFAPVLTPGEAPLHPHNVARGTFIEIDDIVQPAPAPRFSRTAAAVPGAPTLGDVAGLLDRWGLARLTDGLVSGEV